LLAQGIDIEVWHPTHRTETVRERKEDGITICDIPVSRIGKGLCFLSREAKRFASDRASSVEILHFHSVFMRENLQLSKLGIPYVVTPHGGYDRLVLRGRNRLGKAIWFKLWERSYLRKARMIHAVSLPEREAIANLRLDVPVRYIPNGIDGEIFDRKGEAPLRQSDLLYLGRLALDQKGLDLLLKGYAKARAKMPEMPRLVMAGPDFRGGRAELTAMARALDIADRVDFVGPVYGEEKWRLLSQARLFIHVSRWEGMPFALLVAMAIGRPVLVTPGTNLAEEVSAACVRLWTPSLPRMAETCVFTVFSPIPSSAAISLLALPCASSFSTSVSRSVSACGASGARTSRIRRAAACGESWTWPAAAALIARHSSSACVSFRR
jgi:glycosyltransferase involved in cell wall biosynthesis